MNYFTSSYPDPEQNLAFEEWLFEHFKDDQLRIWVNPQSVIIGKHQTLIAEADVKYCANHSIPIIRRISGGGTVYHDQGNINFSFFRKVDPNNPIDYISNLEIIKKSLQHMGYPAEINDRHDLVLNGFKISGNAQHVKKGRALHHGTLLYDANIETLRHAIKREGGEVNHRGVKSVRSRSMNLRGYKDLGTTAEFLTVFQQALGLQLNSIAPPRPVEESLNQLINDRYASETWNHGYSPRHTLLRELTLPEYTTQMQMTIERGGEISSVEFEPANAITDALTINLIHAHHTPSKILEIIRKLKLKIDYLEFF